MEPAIADRVQKFWDEIADFDAAGSDAALDHLLKFLCIELQAQNASWLAGIRMRDLASGDILLGWRPRAYGILKPTPALDIRARKAKRQIEQGNIDMVITRTVALAGQWRSSRLIDLTEPEWFNSHFYHHYYIAHGQVDAIWAGCPVNADTELYFGIFRALGEPLFTEEDRDLAGAILRGLKWFYRRLLLSYGLGIARESLTETERAVLQRLLSGETEKQVAKGLGQSPNTTHVHVKSIYRKFGITNRATLMALWLNRSSKRAI